MDNLKGKKPSRMIPQREKFVCIVQSHMAMEGSHYVEIWHESTLHERSENTPKDFFTF